MRNVELTLQILEEVALRQPVGVSELARTLELPKTTVQRALMTLAKSGWIVATEEARPSWAITLRALTVGAQAVSAQGRLRSVAIPVMEELRRATQETVHLNLYYRDKTVLIERLDGILPVRRFNPFGTTITLHPTAAGRILLSYLTDAELDIYFEGSFPSDHPCDAQHATWLREEGRRNRERGFSITLGGAFSEVHAVAAPIFHHGPRPIAAVSVSAPADRMPLALCEERGLLIAEAARRISLGLRA